MASNDQDDYDGSEPLDFERDEHDPRPRSHRGSTRTDTRDRRVSKFISWGLTALGLAFSTGVWIAANNLYQLNMTVARGMDKDEGRDKRLDDHEARLRSVEKDLIMVEGKTFRGVQGMDPNAKAAPRGK